MWNTTRTWASCLTMFVLCVSATAGPPAPRYKTAPMSSEEFRLRTALCDKTVLWLETRDESVGKECDRLAESLLSLDKPSPRSYFTAAQSAWLRGQPQIAIARLKEAIDKQGDLQAPINGVMPVRAVGPLWIATIARYSGLMTRARDEYKALLTKPSGNAEEDRPGMLSAHMYLAEIEMDHFKNPKEALAQLQAAEDMLDKNKSPGIAGKWIRYERTRLAGDKAQANRELLGESDMMSMPFFVSIHVNMVGLIGGPLREGCSIGVKRDLISEAIHKLTTESDISKIDRMFAQYAAACYYEEKNASEAVKRHLELLEDGSFISPVAGLHAARILKRQGKAADADKVLSRISERYPRFESVVKDLEKSEK